MRNVRVYRKVKSIYDPATAYAYSPFKICNQSISFISSTCQT